MSALVRVTDSSRTSRHVRFVLPAQPVDATLYLKGEMECAFLERQRRLIFRPINHLEKHPPPEHFGLESGGVLFPIGSLANAKFGFLALAFAGVIRRKSRAYGLVHHGETFVREGLIVHWGPLAKSRRALHRRLLLATAGSISGTIAI